MRAITLQYGIIKRFVSAVLQFLLFFILITIVIQSISLLCCTIIEDCFVVVAEPEVSVSNLKLTVGESVTVSCSFQFSQVQNFRPYVVGLAFSGGSFTDFRELPQTCNDTM